MSHVKKSTKKRERIIWDSVVQMLSKKFFAMPSMRKMILNMDQNPVNTSQLSLKLSLTYPNAQVCRNTMIKYKLAKYHNPETYMGRMKPFKLTRKGLLVKQELQSFLKILGD